MSHEVDALNELLRGELSAVKTYELAVEKVDDVGARQQLRQFESQHRAAADALSQHIEACGGKPSTSSGAWGSFATVVQKTANVFGDKSALKSLKEGEEHGLKEYEKALKEEAVPTSARNVIAADLIAKQRQHIASLDRWIEAV